MRNRPWPIGLLLPLSLGLAGCGEEPRVTGPPGAGTDLTAAESAAVSAPVEPPRTEGVGPRPVIGQKTTDIRDARTELAQGGAQIAPGAITRKDPIAVYGNAYVVSVGALAKDQIRHALDLYYAENERYPANLDEFMNVIIKPNGIALPALPDYQDYAYDAEKHELVVLEYPARKEPFRKRPDGRPGRR